MSNRIINNQSKSLNNTLSQLDSFYTPIGGKVNVYKFRKVSGSKYLTRFGELKLNVDVNDYNQVFEVYTGEEPVVVVWENSTKIEVQENDLINKYYSIGDYETCYLSSPQTIENQNDTINLFNKEYVISYLKNNISLQSNSWLPNENDMRDFFYVILDAKTKCVKWLEITDITPIYNEETNKLQYVDINFETINNKYTKSGKTILDFIQLGAIGEGYAFPKETIDTLGNIVVGFEEKFKNDNGSSSLQLDFTSGIGFSSVLITGRSANLKLNENEYRFDKPKILLPWKPLEYKKSNFLHNNPVEDYYMVFGAQPEKQAIWKSYRDNFQANKIVGEYNILNTKEVLTGFKCDHSKVLESNKEKVRWSSFRRWELSDYFKIFTQPIRTALDTISFISKITTMKPSYSVIDFIILNSFVNFSSPSFNFDYTETTKYSLKEVSGVLGGIVNIITGGIDIGWTHTKNIYGTSQQINFLVPCISYLDGKSALNDQAPLPLDIFTDDKSKQVLPVSTNILTSLHFSLTDRFYDYTNKIDGNQIGKGGDGVWDTMYIGQTHFEDGSPIFDGVKKLQIDLRALEPAPPSVLGKEFIIDNINYKAIGSCDVRISAYDNAGNQTYQSIMETKAKARGDIRLWENNINFNYYNEFNVKGQCAYPSYVEPARPEVSLTYYDCKVNQVLPIDTIKIPQFNNDLTKWNTIWDFNLNYSYEYQPIAWEPNHGYNYFYTSYLKEPLPTQQNPWFYNDKLVGSNTTIEIDISRIDINNYKNLYININGNNIERDLFNEQGVESSYHYFNVKNKWDGIKSSVDFTGYKIRKHFTLGYDRKDLIIDTNYRCTFNHTIDLATNKITLKINNLEIPKTFIEDNDTTNTAINGLRIYGIDGSGLSNQVRINTWPDILIGGSEIEEEFIGTTKNIRIDGVYLV